MFPKLLKRLWLSQLLNSIMRCVINLVAIDVDSHGPDKIITYAIYWTGTYTNNPAGDPVDFTVVNNPDGSARNPSNLPGAAPLGPPKTWYDNGGDFGNGAYIGIVQGATLKTWAIRFYQANGNELATNAAYPAGTPATLAATNAMISIGGKVGKF